jgi:hypothetical protein
MFKKNIIVVTGGLGNQLFQIARGLYISNDCSLLVDKSVGTPRVNQEGKPEISSYFDDFIYIKPEAKKDFLGSRVFNFALRFGISSQKGGFRQRLIPLIELICTMGFLVLRGNLSRFVISSGIGFDSRNQVRCGFQVGYFQTFRWLEDPQVLQKLRDLKVKKSGKDLEYLQRIAENTKPLVVHCRFGDYKSESDFGIPERSYYQQAIDLLYSNFNFSEIWVFSDEIHLAKEQIPNEYHDRVRWIDDVDNSSAASLDAMRLGSGYVIANSTFSWWGAVLTSNVGAPVVAPKKWFKNAEDPIDFIPESWTRIDPW